MAEIAGAYTANVGATALVPPNNQWWLKDPYDPTKNMVVREESFSVTPRETVGTFDGVGRDDPVHATDGRKGWALRSKLRTENQAEFTALEQILKSGRVLLLQDGAFPRQWYVKLVETSNWDQIRAIDPSGTYAVRWLYNMDVSWITAAAP